MVNMQYFCLYYSHKLGLFQGFWGVWGDPHPLRRGEVGGRVFLRYFSLGMENAKSLMHRDMENETLDFPWNMENLPKRQSYLGRGMENVKIFEEHDKI